MKGIKNTLTRVALTILRHPLTTPALHTAWQAFLTVWALSGFSLELGVIGAAAGAALSALKGFLIAAVKAYKEA